MTKITDDMSPRDFEQFLRSAGASRRFAKAIIAGGLTQAQAQSSDSTADQATAAALARMRAAAANMGKT